MPDAIGRLHWIVIDTVDPVRIAPFWCALLGVEERGWFGDDYLMLTADAGAPPVAFQRVPETKSVKNRLHVDLEVDDLDGASRRSSRSAVRPSRTSWRCPAATAGA
jgi:Glyoxalase-like domain